MFRDASRAQFQLTTRCLGNCGRRIPTGTRKGRCKWCRRKLDAARNEVAALRPIVLARDGYECQLRLPGCTGRATTADHIVPLSKGGGNELSNMRAACLPCNSGRGNRA